MDQVALPLSQPPTILLAGTNVHRPSEADMYRLHGRWSLHLYRWKGRICVDGTWLAIEPGRAGLTPPGAAVEFRYPDLAEHLYVQFSVPAGPTTSVPMLIDLGERFAGTYVSLTEVAACWRSEPARASAKLWDALWSWIPSPLLHRGHPAVERARVLIDWHLAEDLPVSRLAQQVGVAHNTLTRLFRTELGITVVGYIRARRLERATYLLTQTTMPMRQVAREVGFGDARYLARLAKRHLGTSPRGVRAGLTAPLST